MAEQDAKFFEDLFFGKEQEPLSDILARLGTGGESNANDDILRQLQELFGGESPNQTPQAIEDILRQLSQGDPRGQETVQAPQVETTEQPVPATRQIIETILSALSQAKRAGFAEEPVGSPSQPQAQGALGNDPEILNTILEALSSGDSEDSQSSIAPGAGSPLEELLTRLNITPEQFEAFTLKKTETLQGIEDFNAAKDAKNEAESAQFELEEFNNRNLFSPKGGIDFSRAAELQQEGGLLDVLKQAGGEIGDAFVDKGRGIRDKGQELQLQIADIAFGEKGVRGIKEDRLRANFAAQEAEIRNGGGIVDDFPPIPEDSTDTDTDGVGSLQTIADILAASPERFQGQEPAEGGSPMFRLRDFTSIPGPLQGTVDTNFRFDPNDKGGFSKTPDNAAIRQGVQDRAALVQKLREIHAQSQGDLIGNEEIKTEDVLERLTLLDKLSGF